MWLLQISITYRDTWVKEQSCSGLAMEFACFTGTREKFPLLGPRVLTALIAQ